MRKIEHGKLCLAVRTDRKFRIHNAKFIFDVRQTICRLVRLILGHELSPISHELSEIINEYSWSINGNSCLKKKDVSVSHHGVACHPFPCLRVVLAPLGQVVPHECCPDACGKTVEVAVEPFARFILVGIDMKIEAAVMRRQLTEIVLLERRG